MKYPIYVSMVHLEDGYMLGGRKTEAGRAGEIILVPSIRTLVQRLIVDGELAKGMIP